MTRISCTIVLAVLTAACGPNRSSDTASTTPAAQANGNRSNESARPVANEAGANTPQAEQLVVLRGCLTGGEAPVGTAGASARPPVATRKSADEAQATRGEGGAVNLFRLTNATPASRDKRGVGANGAGASGGPLVNGVEDFAVNGNAAELGRYLNHEVLITGRVDARQTIADAARNEGATAASGQSTSSGTAGSGVGANTTAGAAGADVRPSPQGSVAARSLTVESIQTLSQNCQH